MSKPYLSRKVDTGLIFLLLQITHTALNVTALRPHTTRILCRLCSLFPLIYLLKYLTACPYCLCEGSQFSRILKYLRLMRIFRAPYNIRPFKKSNDGLLGYYVIWDKKFVPTFQRNLLPQCLDK